MSNVITIIGGDDYIDTIQYDKKNYDIRDNLAHTYIDDIREKVKQLMEHPNIDYVKPSIITDESGNTGVKLA